MFHRHGLYIEGRGTESRFLGGQKRMPFADSSWLSSMLRGGGGTSGAHDTAQARAAIAQGQGRKRKTLMSTFQCWTTCNRVSLEVKKTSRTSTTNQMQWSHKFNTELTVLSKSKYWLAALQVTCAVFQKKTLSPPSRILRSDLRDWLNTV
jgi:hypothetical protein